MTPIEQLRPLTPITPLASAETKGYDAGLVGELADQTPFGMIFRSAIENVVETDAAKNEAQYLLSTGQLDNPASLMIAMSKFQTSVDLLVQLRNKALDVYSELTRISL
ncbi:MAG: flagellar hook-basal body complex protein FliE [Oscillibacter sp.]|nr:flagellar hook-basal body complex protein FliE [Oscillibacter sp.]